MPPRFPASPCLNGSEGHLVAPLPCLTARVCQNSRITSTPPFMNPFLGSCRRSCSGHICIWAVQKLSVAPGERTSELDSHQASDWLYTFNVRPEVVGNGGCPWGLGSPGGMWVGCQQGPHDNPRTAPPQLRPMGQEWMRRGRSTRRDPGPTWL